MKHRKASLTSSQIGLLLESVFSGKPALNVLQVIVRFGDEAVDVAGLHRAWSDLARRHDVLRLVLDPMARAGPAQWCNPEVDVDFRQITETLTGNHALDDWLERDRRVGVAVSEAPNWRVRMLDLGPDGPAMVWTFHHALLDGGGYQLLLGEVFALYEGHRRGVAPDLGPAVSFLDHCDAVDRLDHTSAKAYFQGYLSGFDTPNRLAPVFMAAPDPETDPQHRLTLSHCLTVDQATAIRDRARAAGVSTATVVSAAWGLVMARCSGRDEAVIGVTRSGRFLLPDGVNCAGCQINTLPFRISLSAASVDELLRNVHHHARAIRPFEATPLSVIAKVTDTPGDTPLFETIVMFDRGSVQEVMRHQGPEWAHRQVEERSQIATGLTLSVHDDPAMLVQLEYDPARFSKDGAGRLLTYALTVLTRMAESGDRPLAQLDMLPAAETAQVLALGQSDHATHPNAATTALIDLFEATAQAQPTHAAVTQMGAPGATDYATLDQRANHLAWRLREAGVMAGDTVGLALPRSVEYVAALLAAWKVDAAFLPLDPDYPAAALLDMIARASVRLVVTDVEGAERLRGCAAETLRVGPALTRVDAPPRIAHDPERRAYILYTSGSTGKPKAVDVPHRAISHHAHAIRDAFALTPQDRVLQFTSLNFDVSLEEMLPTLVSGASVVLRDDTATTSIPAFLAGLSAAEVTAVNFPTTFWGVLVAHLADNRAIADFPPTVRLVIAGGERVAAPVLTQWQAMFPTVRWLNGYGPTETTITATLFDPAVAPFEGGEVPIGRPLAHVRAFVLAGDGSLAPLGVPGELVLGGNGVARGYLGDPSQTEKAFVADPDGPPGARRYRSGDRVSWRGDRQLAFHGRVDRQIKLRGFRIEISALEALLESDPAVAGAVACLERPGTAQARLLAWVRPKDSKPPPDPVALAARLADSLPPQAVPQIVVVDGFPATPGGKIDIARLPRPTLTDASAAEPGDADPDTRRVQAIFREILDCGPVGPDQSFFDLGGHSLLSIRLMSLIERAFRQRLSLAALYRSPSPRAIMAELRADPKVTVPDSVYAIQPEGRCPPIYAVHIIGPQGEFFRPLSRHLGTTQPVFGLTTDLLAPDAPKTVEDIAATYLADINRHHPKGPLHLIAVSQAAYIAFELAQQLLAAGREIRGLALLDATGPGGRARRVMAKPLSHYVTRLRRNLRGVIHGRASSLLGELRFRVERARLQLMRKGLRVGNEASFSTFSHQAAIDVAISQYEPRPYPRPILVLRSVEAEGDAPEALESGLGWAVVAPAGVQLIDVPGDHLGMLNDPHVAQIARLLADAFGGMAAPPPSDGSPAKISATLSAATQVPMAK